jgi:5-methyltetrahydropteroyltriglutamate--homocysteine methyltransferase
MHYHYCFAGSALSVCSATLPSWAESIRGHFRRSAQPSHYEDSGFDMAIPTEPIGSIPRPQELLSAMQDHTAGRISEEELQSAQAHAVRETIARFEETGSPVITDGEQTKPSFATYPLAGADNLAPDGVVIPFADGHTRQLPRLAAGPFKYSVYAVTYLRQAQRSRINR